MMEPRRRFLMCYLIASITIQPIHAQISSTLQCDGPTDVGRELGTKSDVNSNQAFGYLAETPEFTISCCGKITQWRFRAGNMGTLQLQVWRQLRSPTDGSHLLVGENYCLVDSRLTDITCDVPEQDQFMVQKGDLIGWHSNGEDIVAFTKAADFTDSTLPNMHRRIHTGDIHPGQEYDWSTVEAYNDYDYALQATVSVSVSPTISLSAAVSVPDYVADGRVVAEVAYSDTDSGDEDNLVFYQTEAVEYYNVDLTTGDVTANSSLFRPRDATLAYGVYDTCYYTDVNSQTLTVTDTTVTIDNLPAEFTISESITTQTLLHTITLTDPVDQTYCYGTWNTDDPFMLIPVDAKTFEFYVTEHPEFDFETKPVYTPLTVVCGENKVTTTDNNAASGIITVYLTKNAPPILTNLDDSVIVDATSTRIGDTVFTTTATDPESDVLEFTAVCTPSTGSDCPFQMHASGHIQINDWLIFKEVDLYTFTITVTDSWDNTDTGILSIVIQNVNSEASFTNVPADLDIQITENTAVGTPLYTFEYFDSNNDAKVFSMQYTDDRVGRLFNLDPASGQLSTAFSEFDYETEPDPVFSIDIQIIDKKQVVSVSITITIVDVNEAPWFTEDHFNFVVDEGMDGTQVTDGTQDSNGTAITVIDEDLGDTLRYSLDCGEDTHRFYIDETTSEITFSGPYDLDTTGTPDSVDCTITATDTLGLSDTATLNIYINNVNEFAPEFTQASYLQFLSPYALIGSTVVVVTAFDLDADLDGDKDITYDLVQALGDEYFHVDQDGIIYTAKSLKALFGQTLPTFEVIAYDDGENGTNPLTGTATITVTIAPSTTTAATTTTTDSDYTYADDYRNYITMVLIGGGVFVMILTISIVCFVVCRLQSIPAWFKRHFCPPKPPPRPVQKTFGDRSHENEGFLHDHQYTDEDDVGDGWFKRKYDTAMPATEQPPTKGFNIEPEVHEMFHVPSAASYTSPSGNDKDGSEIRIPSPTEYKMPPPVKEGTIADWDSAYPDVERYYRPYTWKKEQQRKLDFV